MEIYLVRHTKVDVRDGTCYGQSDVAVTSDFQEDAKRVLNKLPDTKKYASYTSPLMRCKLLAIQLDSKELKTDYRIMELNFGDWELKSWESIGKQAFDAWHSDFVNNKTPNGESYFELSTRAITFWEEIILKKENAIIVTHGGVIRALLAHILGLPLENSFLLKIDYGSVSKILLTNQTVTIEYINHI